MKTFLLLLSTANTVSTSLISQAQLIEVDNMLLFSQTTAPVDTKQRLFLFIEASNNIWHCHVCLRVKQCECVRVSGSEPSVCGKCGKAFVSYKSSKMETSAWETTCSPWLQASQIQTHSHTRLLGHLWRCQFPVGKVPYKERIVCMRKK